VADARMLRFFLQPTHLTLLVLGLLLMFGTVLRSFWCRYLCPYGALLGLFSWFSPTHVRRDAATCIDCRRCSKVCPACIDVHGKAVILSPECLGCGRCVEVCPVEGCLGMRAAGKRIPTWAVGAGSIGFLLGAWLLARHMGLWEQNVPLPMLQRFYQMFLS
jgi:polyferredoxin